jgi:tetratricopeptide (TPR) repeat protein
VLSGFFYLAALLAYLRFVGIGAAPASAPRIVPDRRYAVSLALFVCALLAKTVACTLPAALLLILWWKRGRLEARDGLPLVPFFALGAALAAVTVWVERTHVGAIGGDWDLSFVDRCLIAGRAIWFYLAKLVWPASLSFIYPRWTIDSGAAAAYVFPIAAVALAIALFASRARLGLGPFVAFGFFVATVGPALGFFDTFPMRYSFVADHFQYLASLGPIAVAAAAATIAAAAKGGRMRRAGAALAAAVLVVLAARTAAQSRTYRDLETLWTSTLAVNPQAWMAHNNLGLLLLDRGRTDEAAERFRAAIAIKPDDAFARNNLGRTLASTGRFEDAIALFRESLEIEPHRAETWSNLGNASAALGRYEEAAASYRQAIESDPGFADARSNLGNVLFLTGHVEEAIRVYGEAVALDPEFADARYNLGVAFASMGRLPEAEEQLGWAVRLRPSSAEAHHQLGLVAARRGRLEEARGHQREALRLRPDFEEARHALAASEVEGADGRP